MNQKRSRLRLGIMLDTWVQPAWVISIIEEVKRSDYADISLVIKNSAYPPAKISFRLRLTKYIKNIVYYLYTRFDAFVFKRKGFDAFEKGTVENTLKDVPVLEVCPLMKKFSDYFNPENVQNVKDMKFDVILRFGFRILRGEILHSARYGIWSYHHGDNRSYRGGPAGFWEVMEGCPVTGAVLQVLNENLDNGKVIYRTIGPTELFSVHKNKNSQYWKAARFMGRKLRELYEYGESSLVSLGQEVLGSYQRRLYRIPDNLEMTILLFRFLIRIARERLRETLFRRQWFVLYKFHTEEALLENPIEGFSVFGSTVDRFWADPFPFVKEGRFYLFFEEYLWRAGKGHLCVSVYNEKGEWSSPVKILEQGYHLAYPFVFEWNETVYLIPDSSSNRTVDLYRCVKFPDQWVFERTLISGFNACDATLARIDDKWWMFVNIAAEGNLRNWDELHLFHAENPLGPWIPHKKNPVKSDVFSSRPAGRLFESEGRLYRPSQDCSRYYGYGLVINRVEKVDENEYVEERVTSIEPFSKSNMLGTHTFNRVPGLTVLDAQIERFKFSRGKIKPIKDPCFGQFSKTA